VLQFKHIPSLSNQTIVDETISVSAVAFVSALAVIRAGGGRGHPQIAGKSRHGVAAWGHPQIELTEALLAT